MARSPGEPGGVEQAAAAADSLTSASSVVPVYKLTAQMGLALMAVIQSDRKSGRELYSQFIPMKGFLFVGTAVDRILGLLASTIDQPEEAAGHFEDALAFCRNAGYRPELAWSCCDYAEMLLERNNKGGRLTAITLLGESLSISGALGMKFVSQTRFL